MLQLTLRRRPLCKTCSYNLTLGTDRNRQKSGSRVGYSGVIDFYLKEYAQCWDKTVFSENHPKVVTSPVSVKPGLEQASHEYHINLEKEKLAGIAQKTYDIIVLCEMLEHMEVDPAFLLSSLSRDS